MSERQEGGTRDEVLFLKRQNAALRGQNKKLQERVEHYKKLDLEGDALYENKIAECEALKHELAVATEKLKNTHNVIELANAQVKRYQEQAYSLTKKNEALRMQIQEKKPWYKRLF